MPIMSLKNIPQWLIDWQGGLQIGGTYDKHHAKQVSNLTIDGYKYFLYKKQIVTVGNRKR